MMQRQHAMHLVAGILLIGFIFMVLERPLSSRGLPTGPSIVRASLSSEGMESNGESSGVSLNAMNGRYVVFTSVASNLVLSDTNDVRDIFVRDLIMGTTRRVSVSSAGDAANAESVYATMSADGRYIAFTSLATTLVSDDHNFHADVFVHDLQTGTTERVSRRSDGSEANQHSGNEIDISRDGQLVVFPSLASNLVDGDTNGYYDIFIHNRFAHTTERVTRAVDGSEANEDSFTPRLSADGRFVVFQSEASNLVPQDTNGVADIFVYDRQTTITTRVNVASSGAQADLKAEHPDISSDGRYVVFQSRANTLVEGDTNDRDDVFVHDRQTGVTQKVSRAWDGTASNDGSTFPRISGNGHYILFRSTATNLVMTDTNGFQDVFLLNTLTSGLEMVSSPPQGELGNNNAFSAMLTDDGLTLAFESFASNLVPNDTNATGDIFVRRVESVPATPTVTTEAGSLYLPLTVRAYQPSPCHSVEIEPNNSSSEANQYLDLCQGVLVAGDLPLGDPDDYYRIELSSASVVTIDLSGMSPGSDFDLYLYRLQNSTLTEVGVASTNGNANEQIGPLGVSGGIYYVRVYPDPTELGGTRSYQVRWRR